MADHRRREESTPLVPPRSLGGQRGAGASGQTASQSGGKGAPQAQGHGQHTSGTGQSPRSRTQTREQPQPEQASREQNQREQSWVQQQTQRQGARDRQRTAADQQENRHGDRSVEESDAEKTSPLAAVAGAVAAAKDRALGPSPRQGGVSRSDDQVRAASSARPGRTRRARLRLVRVDPWSVMKTAFLLSIAFGIMCVVAVFIIWSVLGAANVFGSINDAVSKVAGESFALEDYIGMDRVLSFTMLIAVLDVVLLTAIATLGAFLYNLAASLLGGLELTLAEDDH